VLAYDPQLSPEHPVIWSLGLDEVPVANEVFAQVQDATSLDDFEDESGDLEGVVGMGLRVETEEGICVIFQKLNPTAVLKKSKRLSMYFTGETFGKVDYDATFQITKDNCTFIYNDKVYILNASLFEYLFDYKAKKLEIADVQLNNIQTTFSANIEIAEGVNLSELLGGDKFAINKLQKLDGRVTLSPEKLQYLKDEFNLEIDINAESGKMVVATKKHLKHLINILNDDHLTSGITEGKYNVQSKKQV
jgi:hypothetical protein